MAITIRDVAREAGVSVATVSKILNHKPGISGETTRRVEEVIKRLDYAPDSRAASLARRSSRSIICLTQLPPDIAYQNPHRFDILCGILSELNEKGYTLTLMNAAADSSPGAAVERIVQRKLADGIVFHGVPIGKDTAALLLRHRFPHIVIGRPESGSRLCWVEINQTLGGQIAAEHLLERGYRRIGYLTGAADDEIAYLRLRGFRIAMQEAGVPIREDWIFHTENGLEGIDRASQQLLSLSEQPDAVICGSNLHAFGLYQVAQRLCIRIPEKMAVITFDKYPYSAVLSPKPTLVHIDVYDLGRTAGRMILRQLRNPELLVQSYATLPQLICNDTTPLFAERETDRTGHPGV